MMCKLLAHALETMNLLQKVKKSLGLVKETKGNRLGGGQETSSSSALPPPPPHHQSSNDSQIFPTFSVTFTNPSLGLVIESAPSDHLFYGSPICIKISRNSDAEKFGIQIGDIITGIEEGMGGIGSTVITYGDFVSILDGIGRPVTLQFTRIPQGSQQSQSLNQSRSHGEGQNWNQTQGRQQQQPSQPQQSSEEQQNQRDARAAAALNREKAWEKRVSSAATTRRKKEEGRGGSGGSGGMMTTGEIEEIREVVVTKEVQKSIDDAKRREQQTIQVYPSLDSCLSVSL
jgi:hypothetical protein